MRNLLTQKDISAAGFNAEMVDGPEGEYIHAFYVSFGLAAAGSVWESARRAVGGGRPTIEALSLSAEGYLSDRNLQISCQDTLIDACDISYEPEAGRE